MRKILISLTIACLISATSVAPVSANDNYYGGMSVFNPLFPIAVALSIPAAIITAVVKTGIQDPIEHGLLAQTAPEGYSRPAPAEYSQRAPEGYARPVRVVYSAPATYYAPRPYYAPRVYVAPSGYYAPRGYYPYGGY